MKEITLSEFLSMIHNNDIDGIEKIERLYNIDVHYETGLWYGDIVRIDNNLNIPLVDENEENITEYKKQVFERYNFLSNNPVKNTNKERCLLLDIIVNNNWSNDYFEKYKNHYSDYGL